MIKRLIRFKIYTDRARWYMQYVQTLIMITILIQTSGFRMLWWYIPILLVAIIFGFIFVGYLEVRIGFLKEEQNKYAEQNPVLQEILEIIKKKESEK